MFNRFDTFSLQGSIKQSYKRFMFQINDEFSMSWRILKKVPQNIKQTAYLFLTLTTIKTCFLSRKSLWLIPEGSCDTEGRSNVCSKISFASQEYFTILIVLK